MDVHDKKTRSYNMSRIRGKDTQPEMLVRRFLFANGFRYRLHVKKLPGKPDIVFPRYQTVIFVHGCFWHAHEACRYFKVPKTRRDWWLKKLARTKEIDALAVAKLERLGWRVLLIWECELKGTAKQARLVELVGEILEGE